MFGRVTALIRDRDSLASRAMSAGMLRLGGHGGALAMRLGGNLIMTRLLAPEAFGLMAMVSALQVALVMFSDIGLRTSIVRSPNGEHPDYLRTAWVMQLVQFAGIAAIILIVAALLSVAQGWRDFGETVYGDPRLPILLALSSLAMISQGLRSTNNAIADRKLLQGRIILIELSSQAVGVAAMLSFAFAIPTVYALVVGMIVNNVVSSLLTHIVLPGPRMGFVFRRDFATEIWGFGRWLVGASIMGFFANQGDRLVLSAFLTKDELGLYAIAILWVGAARIGIRKVMSPTMAALSEVWRERRHDLPRVFRRVRKVQDALSLGIGLGLVFGGQWLMDFLYDDRFAEAGRFVTLLAFMLVLTRYLPFGALLLTAGDSKRIAVVTAVGSAAMLLVTPFAFSYLGLFWATLFIGLNRVWVTPILLRGCAPHLPINWLREGLELALITAFAIGWAFVVV